MTSGEDAGGEADSDGHSFGENCKPPWGADGEGGDDEREDARDDDAEAQRDTPGAIRLTARR